MNRQPICILYRHIPPSHSGPDTMHFASKIADMLLTVELYNRAHHNQVQANLTHDRDLDMWMRSEPVQSFKRAIDWSGSGSDPPSSHIIDAALYDFLRSSVSKMRRHGARKLNIRYLVDPLPAAHRGWGIIVARKILNTCWIPGFGPYLRLPYTLTLIVPNMDDLQLFGGGFWGSTVERASDVEQPLLSQ